MANKDFMLSPTLPNWEAIYKELNTNGMENLQDLPSNVLQQIQDMQNARLGPIDGDSHLSRNWMENTTVEEVVQKAQQQGYYQDTYFPTDAERKLNSTSPIDIPIDGDNLSRYENLTIENMLNHSVEKGIIDPSEVAPDNVRKSVDELIPKVKSVPDDMAVSIKGPAINKGNFPAARPISGDSPVDMEWLANVTVGDMLKVSENMGIDVQPWTDTERKIGRKLPDGEMPLDAETINSQLKGLTIEDMINYSKDQGIDIQEIIPDSQRIGVEYASKDRSIIKDHNALNREKKHLEHINNLKKTPVNTAVEKPMLPIVDASKNVTINDSTVNLRLDTAKKAAINEASEKAVKEAVEEAAEKNLKKSALRNLGHVANGVFAIMDYKDAREAGHSVGRSIVKAGAEFAKGEILGGWYMASMLAKSVPTMAISTVEGINTMSRSMNSMQRRQVFGDVSFQDTQQLATMRQSGMELAKMSQYNLQQAMMGNEAEYMHRL